MRPLGRTVYTLFVSSRTFQCSNHYRLMVLPPVSSEAPVAVSRAGEVMVHTASCTAFYLLQLSSNENKQAGIQYRYFICNPHGTRLIVSLPETRTCWGKLTLSLLLGVSIKEATGSLQALCTWWPSRQIDWELRAAGRGLEDIKNPMRGWRELFIGPSKSFDNRVPDWWSCRPRKFIPLMRRLFLIVRWLPFCTNHVLYQH